MQHRFKQYLSLLLAAATAASLCLNAFAAGLDSFAPCNTYRGQFTDIGGWYEPYVIRGYELGLIDGTGADTFSPDSNMTIAEAVKLAACLHSTYTTGSADFPAIQGQPRWQVYADYCLEEGILAEPFADYGNAITRAQFAVLFAAALPETALTEMNDIPDGTIPDVRLSDSWGSSNRRERRDSTLRGTRRRTSTTARFRLSGLTTATAGSTPTVARREAHDEAPAPRRAAAAARGRYADKSFLLFICVWMGWEGLE